MDLPSRRQTRRRDTADHEAPPYFFSGTLAGLVILMYITWAIWYAQPVWEKDKGSEMSRTPAGPVTVDQNGYIQLQYGKQREKSDCNKPSSLFICIMSPPEAVEARTAARAS